MKKKSPAQKTAPVKVAKKAAPKSASSQKAPVKKLATKKTSTQTAASKKTVTPKVTSTSSAAPKLDSEIKNLTLEGTHGAFNLQDLKGQNVVLYFYPKDNTPGCTTEGHEFSELLGAFKKANAVVYGISRDTLKSHAGFKQKQNYKVDLLSDEKELACSLFDVVKDKNMYGKKVRGIERSTFVIGADGKLKKEWRKVKVEGHAREVLNFVTGLKA